MKIGIDVRPLETGHRFRGIGTYAEELLSAISKIDGQNQYFLYTQQDPSNASKIVDKNFDHRDVLIREVEDPSRYYWLSDQFYFPRAIKKSKADVVHILDQLSCPIFAPVKTIVTVHDLIQLMPIGNPDWKVKLKFKAVKRARKIIAISESVKHDLVKYLKINPEKIAVIYNGYDQETFRPSSDDSGLADFRRKLLKGKAQKYLLYVGSFAAHEPRKNLNFLINIFEKVAKEETDLALVLIGKLGQESDRLKALCRQKGIDNRVTFLDFIHNKQLAPYFQAAEVFLFPSLYEGFGIPPLQALATGTPVISSDTSSLPEVVGEGGIVLSPTEEKLWSEAIRKIVDNQPVRDQLISKGLAQAKKFSWEKCAREVIQLYQEVYGSK